MSTKLVLRSSAAVAAALLAAPALAGPTYTNDNGGSFRWYGQFNPSFQSFDDGVDDYNRLVDNSSSNSRIGFWVEQAFGQNTLRFNFETAFSFRSSDGTNQNSKGDVTSWSRTNLRHIDLQFETANYGTFSAGQGSMATDGITGADFSGTGLAASNSVPDIGGGFFFRDGTGALSGVTVGDAFTDIDGSRLGRVRYDSKNYAGFTFSASRRLSGPIFWPPITTAKPMTLPCATATTIWAPLLWMRVWAQPGPNRPAHRTVATFPVRLRCCTKTPAFRWRLRAVTGISLATMPMQSWAIRRT